MVKAMVATAMETPMQTNHRGPINTPTRNTETAMRSDRGIVMRVKMELAQSKCSLFVAVVEVRSVTCEVEMVEVVVGGVCGSNSVVFVP